MQDMRRGACIKRLQQALSYAGRYFTACCASIMLVTFAQISSAQAQSTPVTVGYRDFNFGSTVYPFPTSEKPESKLWWNDGYWWGSLWNPSTNKYRIHRFNVATQSWVNVGPDIDDRSQSLGDALWDGQKLYIASHIYGGNSQRTNNTTPALSARLYRYSYDSSTKTYNLDSGFPVLVNNAQSETLVLDKDSNGKLWVTWTQAQKVYVNRSMGDDLTWGTPFALPVQGSNLDGDDISTIISHGGNKIGVLWSNQVDLKCYFAFHLDSKPDTDWEPRETALADPNLGAVADDHLNLKMTADDGGTLYCVTKTSLGNSNAPSIYMLRRNSSGVWARYVVANGSDNFTRAILVVDQENRDLYVFAKSGNSNGGTIRMKKTSIDNPTFASGVGTPFIQSSTEGDLNNPTASKHNVDGTTGLLLLAAEETDHYYMHNYIALASNGRPALTSFSPASGVVGSAVTISGSKFTGASVVRFNGTAANFTVNSDAQITATVPSGATTGKISVTNSVGTGSSASDYTVILPPAIISFTPSSGQVGTPVTINGNNFGGVTNVAFNGVSATTFTVNSNTQILAQVPSSATTGSISASNAAGSASSSSSFTVTTAAPTQFTLAMNSFGSGSVELNPPGGIYDAGTEVTLTASPASGWQFSGWSGDMTGSTNPATITMDANKNVTATFVASGPGGQVAHQETRTGGSSSSSSVTTSASLTGVSGDLYLAAIASKSRVAVNNVSGLGLTWARVKAQCAGRDQTGIEVWMAQGTPSANGTVTATLAESPNNTALIVSRYSGVSTTSPIGNVVSGNTTGVDGTCSGGSDNDSYSFNLTTTANGAFAYAAAAMRNRTHTPGAGFTERAEFTQGTSGGSSAGTGVQDRNVATAGTITVDGTFDRSVDWAVVALEIRPQSGGGGTTQHSLTMNTVGSGSVALNPPGGAYDAGTVVTLTATPAAGWQFSDWSGDLTGANNPATITMDEDKSVTATFTQLPATQFSLTVNTAGSGSVALNPPGGAYDAGTEVTLTPNPSSGWQFSGWSGDLTGSTNPATITMDANKNVTATFTQLPATQYTLTVNTAGSGSVALNPSGGVYNAGTEVTLTPNPASGWQFSGWNGDLSGADNPATITMDAHKNVTAIFTATGGSGQVVHQETQTGGSSSSTTVRTSASLSGVSGELYLAAVAAKPNTAVNGVTGLGLNWMRLQAQCAGRDQTGVEIWMAMGSPSGNDAVTATLASAPSNAVIAVSRYSGVDAANPTGSIISGNTNGNSGSCSEGEDNNNYSFSLSTTMAGAVAYGAAAMRSRTHTPGAGYAERAEFIQSSGSGGSAASIAIADQSVAAAGAVSINGTFSGSVDWAVAAVEIRPQLTLGKPGAATDQMASTLPVQFELEPNYPNPFNPGTSIDFSLLVSSNVRLSIYDLNGRLVRMLVTGDMAPGRHTVRWHGNDQFNRPVAAGMYMYRLEVQGEGGGRLFARARRMILSK